MNQPKFLTISKSCLKRALEKINNQERLHHPKQGRFVLCKYVWAEDGGGTKLSTDYTEEGIDALFEALAED